MKDRTAGELCIIDDSLKMKLRKVIDGTKNGLQKTQKKSLMIHP